MVFIQALFVAVAANASKSGKLIVHPKPNLTIPNPDAPASANFKKNVQKELGLVLTENFREQLDQIAKAQEKASPSLKENEDLNTSRYDEDENAEDPSPSEDDDIDEDEYTEDTDEDEQPELEEPPTAYN
jgi:hypothetical protein